MLQKLKDYLLLKLGITELRHDLKQAEKRLDNRFDFLGAYINLVQNEALNLDPAISTAVENKLKAEFALNTVNLTTHKNDIMFAVHLFEHRFHPEQALYSHFKVGARTAITLKDLCQQSGLQPKNILDFGSGYGRVSRFLPEQFPSARIVVSEVKEQALAFQKQHFGFSGEAHSQASASLKAEHFDLIFALSVFTHLPETAFINWLEKLIALLNPEGILIFTFNNGNDPKFRESFTNQNFSYQRASEDSKFSFVSDSLKDTQEYGNTFISHQFLERLLKREGLSYQFLGYNFSPAQEAVLIKKEA